MKLRGLSVVECKYCYNKWHVDPSTAPYKVVSEIKEFRQPRDVDLYHLCGVYGKAGVPVEVADLDYEKYKEYEPYMGVTKNVSDEVCEGVRKGNGVLVAGGYCLYAPAVAGGIQRALGTDKKIGVIWMDAHSDNRIIEDSHEPVRFVAIPVSVMVGQTYEQWRKDGCGLEVPCEGKNMLLSDGRMNGEIGTRNMKDAGIIHLNSEEFEDEETWKKAVEELASRVDAVYLSVDVDILKPEYVPAYDKVVPGGHDIETVMRNIRIVMETGKVAAYSLFCVDFDHYEQNGEWTYLSGMKLIAAGLESWKETGLKKE